MSFLLLLPDVSKNRNWRASSEEYARELAQKDAEKFGGKVYKKPASSTISMLGTIPRQAYYTAWPQENYKAGDIVVHEDPKSKVGLSVHEVKDVKPGKVLTQGTNNARPDGWSSLLEIRGRVPRFYSW